MATPAAMTPEQERARGKKILIVTGITLIVTLAGIIGVYIRLSTSSKNVRPVATLATSDVHAIWIAPGANGGWFAGHHGGLLRSDDNGRTWKAVAGAGEDIMGLATLGEDGRMLAAGHGVLSMSTDGGQTWQPVATAPPKLDFHGLTANPRSQALFAIVVGQGVMMSQDGGQNWRIVQSDVDQDIIGLAEFAGNVSMPGMNMSADQPMLVAVSQRSGVLMSPNDGQQWQSANGAVNLALRVRVTSLASAGNDLYAGTEQGLYRSNDGGRGWFRPNENFSNRVLAVAAGPAQSGLVVAVDAEKQVFVSRDRGASWGG